MESGALRRRGCETHRLCEVGGRCAFGRIEKNINDRDTAEIDNYKITPDYAESITKEITQNVRRLRHHASLGLWCGNNEMEEFALEGEFDGTDETRADYLIQNEYIIPEILRREDRDQDTEDPAQRRFYGSKRRV